MLTYCTKTTAQIDTSTTQKLLQYIMQPLDKNQIPTGFLEEYGCPMLSPATFNGTLTDSNRIDMNLWRTLYLQLQTGWTRATANPLPAITSVNTAIKQNVSSTLPIPIPILLGSYNNVKSNAFSSNLLSYNSSTKQVSDVAGRTQSPYNSKTLFAACPNKNITTKGSESFVIKSNMIWNNTGKSINQIQIDFANGGGFQTVAIGTAINVVYADTGFKKWTIKITLSDNSILQCYNEYNVLKAGNVSSRFQSDGVTFPAWGNINAINGIRAAATVSVNYSKKSPTGTLRKPLIVVEGYDVSFIAQSLQSDYDVYYFINEELSKANVPGWDFNGKLDDDAGYDLVFVNFADGAADIVLNAGAVQEVIRQVNLNKVNDNRFGNIRQQNVVMGLSMGGLCARYALANMTKNFPSTPTETKLLITHDSPHKGANVPLGLQYMIRMLGSVQLFGYNVYDIYPDYNDAIGLLGAPATQQLLLYRALTPNTFATNTFLDATYRPMVTFNAGDPQPTYRFIATANGNECANPLFNPGKTFVNLGAGVSAGIYARFLFFKVPILDYKLAAQVEAYALPAAGSTNKIAKVYTINNLKLFGFINIFKQLYDNTAYAPGNHLAVDGVPGSNYPLLNVDALNQLTNLPIFKLNLYVSFPLGPFLGGYFGVYAYNAGVSYNFTFVSTASALDASPYATPVFSQKYVGGVNPTYPSTSETFIAQETVQNNPSLTNNVHIRFTARNSQWLYNQMEGIANTLNCSSECVVAGLSISGNGTLCTTGTYCVSNIPATTQITWTATPSIVSLAPVGNGSCVNVSRVSNGNVTLTARTACSTSVTKAVRVGIYSTSDYNITQYPSTVCNNGIVQVGMPWYYTPPAPNTTYNWYYGNGLTYISGQGTNVITLRYNSQGPFSTPWVMGRANNDCGQGPFQTINLSVNPNCYSSFAVSPNPSTDVINIEPNTDPAAKATLTKPAEIVQVELTDKMGIIRYRQKFGNPSPTATINVSSLPRDIYTLRIFDGQIWFTHQVIIKH